MKKLLKKIYNVTLKYKFHSKCKFGTSGVAAGSLRV